MAKEKDADHPIRVRGFWHRAGNKSARYRSKKKWRWVPEHWKKLRGR